MNRIALRWTFAAVAGLVPAASFAQDKVTYADHVLPIFRAHCASCHNPDKKSGGLDLTNYTAMMQGGSSGEVVEAGDASLSYLFLVVNHETEPFMPPESDKIPQEKIDTLKKWIDGGLLETASSTAKKSSKPKMDLSLKSAPSGRPEGAPPMPNLISLQPIVRTGRTTAVVGLATSPWAPLAAVAGQQQILLYDTRTAALVGVLPFPEGDPLVLKFSRNGQLLLAGGGHQSAQGKVAVFNVETGERIITVGDELDAVLAADISADQTLIALGGPSKVVRVYSTATGELLHEIRKHTDWVYSLEFSPDSVLLATGDRNGGLHVWEAFTGRDYLALEGHTAAVTGITWRSDSNILATSSEDANVSLWEMNNGGKVKTWGAHGGGTTSLEFTRDGRLVSTGRDRVAKLWDQNGTQQKVYPPFADIGTAVSFCDETNFLIAADWTGAIKVWNTADDKEIAALTADPPTIEERIAALQQQLAAQNADLAQKTEAAKAPVAAFEKAKTDLATATQQVADTKKAADEAAAKVTALAALIEQITKDKTAAEGQFAALTPIVTALKTSLDQVAAAAGKLPEDKELAAVAAQVKTQHDQKAAALAAQQKLVTDKTAELTKATTDKTEADKLMQSTAVAYQSAVKTQETAQAALPPAEQAAAAATALVVQAQQSVATTNKDTQFWTTQLQLSQKLSQLESQQELLVQNELNEEQARERLDAASAELAQAQQEAANAQKTLETLTAQVAAEQKTLEQKTVELKDLQGKSTALEGAIPALTETSAKAKETVAKLPGDQEFAAASKTLEDLLVKRTADLAELKKLTEAKQAEVTAQTAKVAETTKQMQAAQANVTATQKLVADKTAAVAPLTELHKAAQTETAAATQARDTLLGEVEQVRTTLRPVPPANQQAAAQE